LLKSSSQQIPAHLPEIHHSPHHPNKAVLYTLAKQALACIISNIIYDIIRIINLIIFRLGLKLGFVLFLFDYM
jgi:hypothetical protein